MEDQFSALMELLRHQDNINAFNTAAPNHSCGNRECEAECGKVVKIAKNLGVDPVPMVQNAIEETLASKFGCKRKTEAFSNIGKPIPGCKFGYTYGSHPDATDAQLAAGKAGGSSKTDRNSEAKENNKPGKSDKGNKDKKANEDSRKKKVEASADPKNAESNFDKEGDALYKNKDFNAALEKPYSEPDHSLYDQIKGKKKDYNSVVKDALKKREGEKFSAYSDSKGNPTIGVGVNMTNPDNIKLLEKAIGRKLTPKENAVLSKKYDSQAEADKAIKEFAKNIKLTPEQSQKLFDGVYAEHENNAKEKMNKGAWYEKTEKVNGVEKKTRYYDKEKKDPKAWDNLDPVAKAACIDMEYNGALKKYHAFEKSVKKGDYKRAAYELLNSADFKENDEGVQNRRRDMAKDFMKLHGEKSKKSK